jgi:hypothetical protein
MQTQSSIFDKAHGNFRGQIMAHRHTALLVALVFGLLVRPLIGDTLASTGVYSTALIVLLIVALYNINIDELVGERDRLLTQSRRRVRLGWVLAAAAVLLRFLTFFMRSTILNLAEPFCWLLFFLFVTLSELRSVLKQREVTGETIHGHIDLPFTRVYLDAGIQRPVSTQSRLLWRPRSYKTRRSAALRGSGLFQPDFLVHHWIWRYHAADSTSPLCGGCRGDHRAVLSGNPGRAAGGIADESIRWSGGRK